MGFQNSGYHVTQFLFRSGHVISFCHVSRFSLQPPFTACCIMHGRCCTKVVILISKLGVVVSQQREA